jgi:hypothetical protein
MRRNISVLAVALGALLCQAPALLAHHSNSAFQVDQTIKLKGVVTEFKWMNPHIWIYLSVDDDTGGKVEWHVEGRPPGILGRAGWTKNSLKPGWIVTILCNPAKDGSRVAMVARVTLENGYVLRNEPFNIP